MKYTTVSFRKFLDDHDALLHLKYLALQYASVVTERLNAGAWPLESAADIDRQEARAIFNGAFGLSSVSVEICSRAEMLASPQAAAATRATLIPVHGAELMAALRGDIEPRMGAEMEAKFKQAMMSTLDPDGAKRSPPGAILKDIPPEFAEGLMFGIFAPFVTVAIAALGDVMLFDRIVPVVRLVQRCLFLGFKDPSRRTLLFLAA